jgi:hypothetical protein
MAELLEAWCFKGTEKFIFLFLYFWLGLLFCKLLRSDFDELVSMMECDPGYSMDTFYELCESRFWWRIGVELSRERGEVERRKIYKVG